jgi:hypothetical protein
MAARDTWDRAGSRVVATFGNMPGFAVSLLAVRLRKPATGHENKSP